MCNGTQSISCSPCCKLALMEDNRLQVPLPACPGCQFGASENVAKLSLPLPDTECRIRGARIVPRYLFLAVNHEDCQGNDDSSDSSVWGCVGGGCRTLSPTESTGPVGALTEAAPEYPSSWAIEGVGVSDPGPTIVRVKPSPHPQILPIVRVQLAPATATSLI